MIRIQTGQAIRHANRAACGAITNRVRRMTMIACLVCLGGCGSTHHMIPLRPPGRHDIVLNLTWHFDMNLRSMAPILPEANAYFGMGNGNVAGLGFTTSGLMLTQLSFLHYAPSKRGNWAVLFSHLNQLSSLNSNPYFEGGAGYVVTSGSFAQSFQLGLGFGTGRVVPLLFEPRKALRQRWHLFPVIKYGLGGRDILADLTWYPGLDRFGTRDIHRAFNEENDTLYVFPTSVIAAVMRPQEADTAATANGIVIVLTDGTGVHLTPYGHFGQVASIGPFPLTHSADRYVTPDDSSLAYISFGRLREDWVAGKDVVILRYDPTMKRMLDWNRGIVSDLSIGIGVQSLQPSRRTR